MDRLLHQTEMGDRGHNHLRIDAAPPASPGSLVRAPGFLPEWRVGAVIEAVAVRDAVTGQLWLNIGQTRLAARLASGDPLGPADGETLRLRVLRNSPVLAFETLEPDTPAQTDPAGDALRRLLPRQASPALLLANVAWLHENGDSAQALPSRVTEAIAKLWAGLPAATQLTGPEGLKTALLRSGLFLESQLATAPATNALKDLPTRDLKALLLSLRSNLGEHGGRAGGSTSPLAESVSPLPMLRGSLPPLAEAAASLASTSSRVAMLETLTQQTDGALSRLTATQMINAAAHGLACLIELPVRHEDDASMLRFRFEREPAHPGEQDASWTVEAALSLRHGETVHARVALRAGRISVQLRSDSAAIVAQLKSRSGLLANVLQTAGLDVDQVVCLNGLPVTEGGHSRAQLVDARA
jgi:Flagellar hook-length control protein FliK